MQDLAGDEQADDEVGQRGETEDNFLQLSRDFRRLAGFTDDELEEIAELSAESGLEVKAAG